MTFKLWVAMVAGIALVGCTTMQEVRPEQGALCDLLEIGDHIIVYERNGRTTGAVLGGIVLAPIAAVGAGVALSSQ